MAPFAETPIYPLNGTQAIEVSKEPDLFDGWWTKKPFFELEKRSIFCKTWLCVTHRSRFTKPGDYMSMNLAGFPILMMLGKDGIVRAFHNVCRHRAYTVTKKPAGSSLVLGCRYHGWSYNTRGELVKAPHFDGIEGFDKSQNGLFQIRTCTDRAGFIHVNLNSSPITDSPDCEDIVPFATEHDISTNSKLISSWEQAGSFNWKVLAQDISMPPSPTEPSTLSFIRTFFIQPPPTLSSSFQPLNLFPTMQVISLCNSPLWLALGFSPLSPTETSIRCNIFTSSTPSRSSLPFPSAHVASLKQDVSTHIQNLEKSYLTIKSTIPPPLEYSQLLSALKEHLKLEKLRGTQIWPAVGSKGEERSLGFWRAEKVCRELDALGECPGTGNGAGTGGGGRAVEW